MKKMILKNWFYTAGFCILAIIVNFAIYNVTHELLTHIHVEQRLAETIGRVAASACILLFYNRVFHIEDFGLRNENFFRGLLIGGFMILATLNNLAGAILETADVPAVMPSVYLILIVIVEQILIGVFEEFLFRGLILNILLEKMQKDSFKNKMAAIVISAVLFGLVHLLNLFSMPQLVNATIGQVVYAFFIGIFLGALYLRTHNIWVVVFYHAIYDMASELPLIFHDIPAQEIVDSSVSDTLLNTALASTFLFVGLFIARKLKEKAD